MLNSEFLLLKKRTLIIKIIMISADGSELFEDHSK
jgi:hypothetical protein